MIVSVTTENQISVFVCNIADTHHRPVTQSRRIHHESVPGVRGKDFKRGFVFVTVKGFIRQDNAIRSTANIPPLSQFSVLRSFIFRESIIVQLGNCVRNTGVILSSHILNGFSHQIADLEGNDFIGSVLYNFVVNLRPNFLLAVQNRLISLVIAIEIINLSLVLEMNRYGLLQN